MTMIPAQNLYTVQQIYGGGSYNSKSFDLMKQLEGYEYCSSEACLGSDLVIGPNPMAEDESRTESVNEAGSSSKDEKDGGNWLQLSIGGHSTHNTHLASPQAVDGTNQRAGLIELDLLPIAGSQSHSEQIMRPLTPMFHLPEFRAPRPVSNFGSATSTFNTSMLLQQTGSSSSFHHQDFSWAFRPFARNVTSTAAAAASSSTSLMPPGSYFNRPFQLQAGMDIAGGGSSLDFRVVDPPRRPLSGIWFMLQASQNQAKEPFLPQISKSYLRIKDGRMTIRLLMKYLVNKLRLDSESEIEITCRGQQLLPFLTLQHVRDNIWNPREIVTLIPDSSTTDYLMVLHYGRSA